MMHILLDRCNSTLVVKRVSVDFRNSLCAPRPLKFRLSTYLYEKLADIRSNLEVIKPVTLPVAIKFLQFSCAKLRKPRPGVLYVGLGFSLSLHP